MIEPQFTGTDLAAEFERQHANCRQCHPELGRDYLRAGVLVTALSGSLVAWIAAIAWLTTRWN